MSDDTYNGWANRETWAFWLWVNNDQGWYEMVREYAAERIDGKADPNNLPTFGWSSLCEEDPEEEGYCAYHRDFHDEPEVIYDHEIGRAVVDYVKETLDELEDQATEWAERTNRTEAKHELRTMRDDIGSFWRIDYSEIGAAAREMVEES